MVFALWPCLRAAPLRPREGNLPMPKTKKSAMPKETKVVACEKCEGPFELWGLSSEFRLVRCQTCGTVCFVDWSEPFPIRNGAPQETYAIPADFHLPS